MRQFFLKIIFTLYKSLCAEYLIKKGQFIPNYLPIGVLNSPYPISPS